MLTVLTILGTRPEITKMAPVIAELTNHPTAIRPVVCSTGQHREMLKPMLDLFQITPDYDLNLMQENQSLAQLTANLFSRLDPVVQEVRPDWILAQGDTTTVLVAALIAHYHRVAFGHVEAGLRTGDKFNPFPEEINRRVSDVVADLFFAPTERARQALLKEGAADANIYVTGNTQVDALLQMAARCYDWSAGPLASIPTDRRLVLITAHRRESFGAPFRELCAAIRELARRFEHDGVQFVYPVHLNPNVQKPVHEMLSGLTNVSLIAPLDYLSMVHLMKRAVLVLTDSGGIQEEAPSFGVPVLVLREKTERPEGIEQGVARLVGTQRDRIIAETERLLTDSDAYAAMSGKDNPYGDGQAAKRIVAALLERTPR